MERASTPAHIFGILCASAGILWASAGGARKPRKKTLAIAGDTGVII